MRAHPQTLPLLGLTFLFACAANPEPSAPSAPIVRPPDFLVEEFTSPIDVEHYTLNLRVDSDGIDGTCAVRLFPLSDLEEIELDLVGLEVTGVDLRGGGALDFERRGGRLVIEADARAGIPLELVVAYGGVPAKGLRLRADGAATDGSFDGARHWFPCQDHPADRVTSEWVLDLPATWSSLALGERIESVVTGERRRERWRLHLPHSTMSERLGIVAGEANRQYAGGVEWTLREGVEAPAEELAFLERVLGPVPVRHLAGEDLSVEELASLWFELSSGPRDARHAWMAEALPAVCDYLWNERQLADAEAELVANDLVRADRARRTGALVRSRGRSLAELWAAEGARSAGVTRLLLLRDLVGPIDFEAGLRRFVSENRGRPTTTRDLRTAMERASSRELGAFFDQWFHRPGMPVLETSWVHDPSDLRVLLSVNQVHEVEGGAPATYPLTLEVEIATSEGVTQHLIGVTERRSLLDLYVAEEPLWVVVDPIGSLPAHRIDRKETKEWRALLASDSGVLRRRAIEALTSSRVDDVELAADLSEALSGLLARDPHAAIRRSAAAGLGRLGGAGGDASFNALCRAGHGDADDAVRTEALMSLTAVGPNVTLFSLAREVMSGGPSAPVGGAAAMLGLSADPVAAPAWMRGLFDAPDADDRLAKVCHAYALSGDAYAPALLSRLARSGVGDLRREATRALGHLPLDDRNDRLVLLGRTLESRDAELRQAAIDALSLLASGDETALRLLTAYYPTSTSAREQRRIEAAFRR